MLNMSLLYNLQISIHWASLVSGTLQQLSLSILFRDWKSLTCYWLPSNQRWCWWTNSWTNEKSTWENVVLYPLMELRVLLNHVKSFSRHLKIHLNSAGHGRHWRLSRGLISCHSCQSSVIVLCPSSCNHSNYIPQHPWTHGLLLLKSTMEEACRSSSEANTSFLWLIAEQKLLVTLIHEVVD